MVRQTCSFFDDAIAALRYGIEAVRKSRGIEVLDVFL